MAQSRVMLAARRVSKKVYKSEQRADRGKMCEEEMTSSKQRARDVQRGRTEEGRRAWALSVGCCREEGCNTHR